MLPLQRSRAARVRRVGLTEHEVAASPGCRRFVAVYAGDGTRKSGSQWTLRWREMDSNHRYRIRNNPFGYPVRSRNSPSATKTGSFVPGTDGSNPSPSSGESSANLTLGRFRGAVSSQDSVYRVCERVFESMLRFYDRHAAAELCVGHAQHVCASRFRRRGQQPAGN